MAGKKSRAKGYRGENEARHFLGPNYERTGYAGTDKPDLTSSFAVISVKNHKTPLSLRECLTELIKLEAQAPDKAHCVMVKVKHKWVIVERAEQFRDYHG